MAYMYDVFISYKRDPVHDGWLEQHFVPLFTSWVRQEIAAKCGRPPAKIFFDQTEVSPQFLKFEQTGVLGIEPGQEWQQALSNAIKTSRCMLGLWSPLYFYSNWCLVEWESFNLRAQALVKPISIHDGESFPVHARAIQGIPDFAPYVNIGGGYRETPRYVEFQDQIRNLARTVALAVRDAPSFAEFPIFQPPAPKVGPDIPQQKL